MSKYQPLWVWVGQNCGSVLTLTFDRIAEIAGMPIDHSFLRYKKELTAYGCRVGKISMKARTVTFERTESAEAAPPTDSTAGVAPADSTNASLTSAGAAPDRAKASPDSTPAQ